MVISVNTEITDCAVKNVGNCSTSERDAAQGHEPRWLDWVLLGVLPLAALMVREQIPAWVFMWVMALAFFFGCKWLTWRRTWRELREAFGVRRIPALLTGSRLLVGTCSAGARMRRTPNA